MALIQGLSVLLFSVLYHTSDWQIFLLTVLLHHNLAAVQWVSESYIFWCKDEIAETRSINKTMHGFISDTFFYHKKCDLSCMGGTGARF